MWLNSPFTAPRTTRLSLAILAILLICGGTLASAQTIPVGSGSYTTLLPDGASNPENDLDIPVFPVRTDNVTGPVPTTDWWTPIVFKFRSDNPYSQVLAGQPLVNQGCFFYICRLNAL